MCREPGCEKIRGFTYSGGLLRHQREVHRHHGGPRAPRFCPHRDCKRSSGQGFSRRENLNEHLRRVHRGAGLEEEPLRSPVTAGPSRVVSGPAVLTTPQQTGLQTPAPQTTTRKRRRTGDFGDLAAEIADNEPFKEESSVIPPLPDPTELIRHLRGEIEGLRAQLAERDETIRRREAEIRQLRGLIMANQRAR